MFDWSRVALRPRLGDFHLSPDDDQSALSMTSCTGFELPFILNAIHEILEAQKPLAPRENRRPLHSFDREESYTVD